MSENQKKILQMLSEGKISVDEAQRLLALTGAENEPGNRNSSNEGKSLPRFMHVIVEPKPGAAGCGDKHEMHKHKVNIRVPFGLIRAGIKLATLIPSDTADQVDRAFKDKGLNFDIRRLKDEDLEDLMTALRNNEISVDGEHETVKVYAE